MIKNALKTSTILVAVTFAGSALAMDKNYGPYPVTLKDYSGEKTNTVSYSGQIARHVMEASLKSLAGKGDGTNADELEAQMLKYFNGSDEELAIIAPAGKDGFAIKQKTIQEISSSANLAGKIYDGAMTAWPGNLTGKEAALDIIAHAAASTKGYDADLGYDWGQVLSKYLIGAVAYHQAVDNYLDEKMTAYNKPNNKPYKDGAHYTGKEHSWDEAFGYWGGPAHTTSLDPNQLYNVSKRKDFESADKNGDGVVDLKSEFVFSPAYYAAGADKGGTKSTSYAQNIMNAFLDGRAVITEAAGEALNADQLAAVQGYAATIEENWEKVLAEAVFKYAGSVYKDITKLGELSSEDEKKEYFRTYAKHWGELKGFSMALQTGKNNLGKTAVEMNKLIGFGPVTMDLTYVTGVDADGKFVKDAWMNWSDYQLNMLQVQKLMVDTFNVASKTNDVTADLAAFADKLSADQNAETD
ncbi:MAG: DUF4856 domain-containing protein [Rhizobiaceae bacterium]|nr:DUF4856 domain-containing protein [Rhizobiaceae bacterium]